VSPASADAAADPGPARPRDWDAATYDRIADPMTRWGAATLDRLPLHGAETVLDAGCGSGRVTELLLERLPRGRVIALDVSPSMVGHARRRLETVAGGRVTFVVADLAAPLPLEGPVDAVFSNATFHWISNHEALYGNLAAVLRPGGRLVAQCGGGDNIASVRHAVEEVAGAWGGATTFAAPDATRLRLGTAGFVDVRVWLEDAPVVIRPGEPLETYLDAIILRDQMAELTGSVRRAFVRAVAARLDGGRIDYVRLNIDAARGEGRTRETAGRLG